MNTIELSEKLFFEKFIPKIKDEFPDVLPLISAGLVGEGSECFGYDDELSKDHDWGIGFCVWIKDELLPIHEKQINKIYDALPDTFEDVHVKKNDKRARLYGVEEFYKSILGDVGSLNDNSCWFLFNEASLACATNGKIFKDDQDLLFSSKREFFKSLYSDDVVKYKMAASCARAGQIGQYNYLRNLERKDIVSLQTMKGKFYEEIMHIIFLMNKEYMPYYKWAARKLKELPLYGKEISALLYEMSQISDGEEYYKKMNMICAFVSDKLYRQHYSDSSSIYMMDQCEALMKGITDEELRRKPVSLLW